MMTPRQLVELVYGEGYRRALAFAYSWTRPDMQAAEDLVQITAMHVLALTEDRELRRPWAYWLTAVKHAAHDVHRKQKLDLCGLAVAWNRASGPEPQEITQAIALVDEIASAIEALSPAVRRDMIKYIETGRTESVNERVNLCRARHELRAALGAVT